MQLWAKLGRLLEKEHETRYFAIFLLYRPERLQVLRAVLIPASRFRKVVDNFIVEDVGFCEVERSWKNLLFLLREILGVREMAWEGNCGFFKYCPCFARIKYVSFQISVRHVYDSEFPGCPQRTVRASRAFLKKRILG